MKIEKIKRILVISGFDPTGGAGMMADSAIVRLLHCYPVGVVTCQTLQDSKGFHSMLPADPQLFARQLEALLKDFRPDAVKIGMIPSKQHLEIITEMLEAYPHGPVVFDPIMAPTDGEENFKADWWTDTALLTRFLSNVDLITPNDIELDKLSDSFRQTLETAMYSSLYSDSGSFMPEEEESAPDFLKDSDPFNDEFEEDEEDEDERDEEDEEAMKIFREYQQTRILKMALIRDMLNVKRILLTGGHSTITPHMDLLLDNVEELTEWPEDLTAEVISSIRIETPENIKSISHRPRRLDVLPIPGMHIETPNTHGTGCIYSTAIACYSAILDDFKKAVFGSKQMITLLLKSGADCKFYKSGKGPAFIAVDPGVIEENLSPDAAMVMN